MKPTRGGALIACGLFSLLIALSGWAADHPTPKEGDWVVRDYYNPASQLERIEAALLAINSADDERKPPELGVLEREIKRVKRGRYVLIPASNETRGHGTTAVAKWWKHHLIGLLQSAK
jgi:hypothetical protein